MAKGIRQDERSNKASSSPVTDGKLVVFLYGSGDVACFDMDVYAITTQGNGALDDHAVVWTSRGVREVTSEVPTPAYYDGDFFVLSDSRNSLSRVAARTGKVVWSVRTPGRVKYEASPLAADEKIFVINFDGQTAVLSAASGEVLHVIPMDKPADGEMVRASIIAAHGQLFIRTTRKLYCVGKGR